jgi:hypothetical protein
MAVGAAVTPSPFWFITRGTGAVAHVLLTLTVALGVANLRRTRIGDMPRFVVESIHRTAALLAVSFVGAHAVTTLLDGFAPIAAFGAFIPFKSAYRPIWLGLGAVAFDLLIAVVVTSLLRRRLGYGAWRLTHWLAYASWPVALVHGLGTGTDAKTHWMLLLTAGCVGIVLIAVAIRISDGWPDHLATRLSALGAAALVPLGLLVWLPAGPLGAGWARRAGTPMSLLANTRLAVPTSQRANPVSSTAGSAASSAQVDGRFRQVGLPGGLRLLDISLTVRGRPLSNFHIRIRGVPVSGGGVRMTTSRVTLGPQSNPDQYIGRVTSLAGSDLAASVSDGSGSTLSVLARLQIAAGPGSAAGTVIVAPGGSP